MKIKVWGLPRSGTHYIVWMMEKYLGVEARLVEGGWGHGPPMEVEGVCLHVCMVKQLHAWIASMHDYERLPNLHLSWYVDIWMAYKRAYERLEADHPDRWMVVEYLDALLRPQAALSRIAERAGVGAPEQKPAAPRNVMGRMGDHRRGDDMISVADFTRRRLYYERSEYMERYTDEAFTMINDRLKYWEVH